MHLLCPFPENGTNIKCLRLFIHDVGFCSIVCSQECGLWKASYDGSKQKSVTRVFLCLYLMPNPGLQAALHIKMANYEFLFKPLVDRIQSNGDFEVLLENVHGLLVQCERGYIEIANQVHDNILESFNEWLCTAVDKSLNNQELLINELGERGKELSAAASKVIDLRVSGFRFGHFCRVVGSIIERQISVLDSDKNALALFFTCFELYRVCVDLYYFRKDGCGESVSPFYKHAHEGAKFLESSWLTYGKRLFQLFRKLRVLSISDIIHKIVISEREPTPCNVLLKSEAIAVADYAYCENKKHKATYVQYNALPIDSSVIPTNEQGQFLLDRCLKGTVVELNDVKDTIWLGFTGTNCFTHFITDVVQIMGGPDSVYFAAVGITRAVKGLFPTKKIIVTGHSLGGGLTQFSVSAVMDSLIQGLAFNSAGLSEATMDILEIHQERLKRDDSREKHVVNMSHILMQHDVVSTFGTLVGKVEVLQSPLRCFKAHKIGNINKAINNNKPTCITINN